MKQLIAYLFFLVVLTSCSKKNNIINASDKESEQITVNLTVDGKARSFVVYNPKGYNNAGKMPMIFVNHGGQGNSTSMIQVILDQLLIEIKLY